MDSRRISTYPQKIRAKEYNVAEILIPVAASGANVPSMCEKVDENIVNDQIVKNMRPERSLLDAAKASWVYAPIGKYQVTN